MIDWTKIKHFKASEFPEAPDQHADPRLIQELDAFREAFGGGVTPSPAKGALARFDGSATSRHYAVGRQSDAVDIFPKGEVRRAYDILAADGAPWGGIGIYPFTHPSPMLHIDLRPLKSSGAKTIWARDKDGTYIYPNVSEAARRRFEELLALL